MKIGKSFKIMVEIPQKAIDEITKSFRERIVELEQQKLRLIDNAESEKINELQHEIENLNKQLEMSVAELDSEKELKAYEKFCKKHEKCRLSSKVNGGKIPYVVFYGTGFGTCKKVVCQVCGKEKDITDISIW